MRLVALTLALIPALPAQAQLTVSFQDGAPKDLFTLRYDGNCPLTADVTIDLGTAPTGLIFDITASGAGVSVYQPLEWVQGAAATSNVTDGDTTLTVSLRDMQPGEVRAFTVDIDDTTSARPTIVDGSEMAGATLRAQDFTAEFDGTGTASLPLDPCLS